MIRCAIYARYSSDLQHDRSIDDQTRNCRRFAEKQGWQILDEHTYADRAVSGTTIAGRAGLARMVQSVEAKRKPFDCVLVDDTSRLSRDRIEQGQIIRELQEHGIFVYFVSDNIDTRDDITQDVILPVYGIKDSLYCRELAKKTKRGMSGQVLNGFNAGGRTYGYSYYRVLDPTGAIDKKTQQVRSLGTRVEPNPKEAAVVRRIFEMYVAGHGLKAIASTLTDDGVKPPGAARQLRGGAKCPSWCPNAVRNMLRNPKYIGDWTWNRTASMRRSKTGKRTYSLRPQDEWVPRHDPSLAVVDLALWEKVQLRFRNQVRTYSTGDRASRRKYLLSGILKCGVCGASLIVSKIYPNGDTVYRCGHNWQRGAKACPNNVSIRGLAAESRVVGALRARLYSRDLLDMVVCETNRLLRGDANAKPADLREIATKRHKTVDAIAKLIALVTDSEVDLPSVRTAIQQKEQELAECDRLLALRTQLEPRTPFKLGPAEVKGWLDQLAGLMKSDVALARHHLTEIVGSLSGTPRTENGQIGLLFTGKPLVQGILGMIDGASNSTHGGGAIFDLLEVPQSIIAYMDAAKMKRA